MNKHTKPIFTMEKEPLNFSICNQKGGVGKSTLTVFATSWLHYVLGRNVLVVDCGEGPLLDAPAAEII